MTCRRSGIVFIGANVNLFDIGNVTDDVDAKKAYFNK